MAAQRSTFLRRGSASKAGNTGKEMVEAEELEPSGTEGLVGDLVVTATTAGELSHCKCWKASDEKS